MHRGLEKFNGKGKGGIPVKKFNEGSKIHLLTTIGLQAFNTSQL